MQFRFWGTLLVVLTLSACTPAEQQYCERMATPPASPEYAKCVRYYFDQTAYFNAERDACEFEADRSYPRSLYDHGRTAWVHGGYGPHGYYGGHTVDIAPDYAHNELIDQLRMQIIGPCMYSKGWRDPNNWEAGKGPVPKAPRVKASQPSSKLPWLR